MIRAGLPKVTHVLTALVGNLINFVLEMVTMSRHTWFFKKTLVESVVNGSGPTCEYGALQHAPADGLSVRLSSARRPLQCS